MTSLTTSGAGPAGGPVPETDGLDEAAAARVRMTVACRDTDRLPKVAGAGTVVERDGRRVQVMHNGVLVEEGCYFGPWMTEIIRCLRGHHEPQEEVAFAAVVRRVRATVAPEAVPTIVELGAFWAYYSLWFLDELPGARAVALEPDPANLEVGRRNFALNGRTGTFLHGAIGAEPGTPMTFVAESSGEPVSVPQFSLDSLLEAADVAQVDVLLSDIQGAELALLRGAMPLLRSGRVRFLVLSTHHHTISGEATTHQEAVRLLREVGAHILAEHSVGESCSGDGLVVAAFRDEDADLQVDVSHGRYRDSLFGELEHDTERFRLAARDADARVVALGAQLSAVQDELAAVRATRLFRWSAPARGAWGRVRWILRRHG